MGHEEEDQRQLQQDYLDQERLALDCVVVCFKHGLEGTADQLAPLLGINDLWRKTKSQLQQKAA